MKIFYIIVFFWLGWLLWDGFSNRGVWVKGGAKDRLTRKLDMHAFAHKVSRDEHATTYWGVMLFYFVGLCFMLYLLLVEGA